MRARVRQDLQNQGLGVPIGEDTPNEAWLSGDDVHPVEYMNGTDIFRIFYDGQWVDANPIDFELLPDEPKYLTNICPTCGAPQLGVHYHEMEESDDE